MFQTYHEHGSGQGVDAQGPVLRLQDGTGRNRPRIPDLSGTEKRHGERIHHSPPDTGTRHLCLRILHRAGLRRCIHTYKGQPCAGQQRRLVDQKGTCKAGTQTPGILRQQYPPATGSAGHSKKIRRPSYMSEEKPLPACHLQPTDEQLFERNCRPMRY